MIVIKEDLKPTVETLIPLNRYSFEELNDKRSPPLQIQINITLQDDNKLIFQGDDTGQGVVVQKLEWWIPQLQMTYRGQKLVNDILLRPTHWSFLQETIATSSHRRDARDPANNGWREKPQTRFRFLATNRQSKYADSKSLPL